MINGIQDKKSEGWQSGLMRLFAKQVGVTAPAGSNPPPSAKHICKTYEKFCTCYNLALEPDEDCEIHGYKKHQPRCRCGRFVKEKGKAEDLLKRFVEFCQQNPHLRFWQALSIWSGYVFLGYAKDCTGKDFVDLFFHE